MRKANWPLWGLWRCHPFPLSIKHLLELIARIAAKRLVAHRQRFRFVLQLRQLLGQVLVRGQRRAHLHESAHSGDYRAPRLTSQTVTSKLRTPRHQAEASNQQHRLRIRTSNSDSNATGKIALCAVSIKAID
jgi:hypothetical protein